jgi:hypothetical protein
MFPTNKYIDGCDDNNDDDNDEDDIPLNIYDSKQTNTGVPHFTNT